MKHKTNATTGESTASRVTIDDWRSGRFTVDEFRERIAEQCGQPFDGTIEAVEAEEERPQSDEDYGNQSGSEENSDDRAWNEVENHQDDSDGQSDAERNA